jgi:hypothetical protein
MAANIYFLTRGVEGGVNVTAPNKGMRRCSGHRARVGGHSRAGGTLLSLRVGLFLPRVSRAGGWASAVLFENNADLGLAGAFHPSTVADAASDYLDLVKDWAYELETSEDVIERRLFQLGEKQRAPRKR